MNYDKDSISILKQSSFIDCNYLRAAKEGCEVFHCFIARSAFTTIDLRHVYLKKILSCKASRVNYS